MWSIITEKAAYICLELSRNDMSPRWTPSFSFSGEHEAQLLSQGWATWYLSGPAGGLASRGGGVLPDTCVPTLHPGGTPLCPSSFQHGRGGQAWGWHVRTRLCGCWARFQDSCANSMTDNMPPAELCEWSQSRRSAFSQMLPPEFILLSWNITFT